MKRIVSALSALVAIMAIAVAAPWLLIRLGRLDALLTLDWRRILTIPDDGSALLGVLTLTGWVAWLMVVGSLVCELVAVLSHGRLRPLLPGTKWFRPVVTALVAALLGFGIAAPLAVPKAQAQTPEPSPASEVSVDQKLVSASAATPTRQHIHLVQPGDDLWSLAERYYGDGGRWQDIVAANDTTILDADAELVAGSTLALPSEGLITVEAGDTLWGLADEHLGDAKRWPELHAANLDQIKDPDLIRVGWKLRVPLGSSPSPAKHDLVAAPVTGSSSGDSPSDHSADSSVSPSQSDTAGAQLPATTQPPPDSSSGDWQPPNLSIRNGEQPQTSNSQWPGRAPNRIESDSVLEGVDVAQIAARIGPITATTALGLSLLLAGRRAQQLRSRPLGRRIPHPGADGQAFEGALRVHGAFVGPFLTREPLVVDLATEPAEGTVIDCAGIGLGHIHVDDLEDAPGLLSAIASALLVQDDGQFVDLVLIGSSFEWLACCDEPRVRLLPSDKVNWLVARLEERTAAVAATHTELADLRSTPELAAVWTQQIVLVDGSLPIGLDPERLRAVGITAIGAGLDPLEVDGITIIRLSGNQARIGAGPVFTPALITPRARRTLAELFTISADEQTTAADWWSDEPLDAAIVSLPVLSPRTTQELAVDPTPHCVHPTFLMLGPVELVGARGPVPGRAIKQCMEYGAWILLHPAQTPPVMVRSLLVAEGTRRSNMSRLRGWLGEDEHGEPYLPDAYSGRIEFHPGVTSDWERLNVLISGGVNRASDTALIRALELVRGAPLADAAPGQWHWAEELRTDMVSTIRDIGVVLAQRALERDDLELARWAIQRAWSAAPGDDLLMMLRIRGEYLLGNQPEVERLVLHVTRSARARGADLSDDMVTLLQEVMEGAPRVRSA